MARFIHLGTKIMGLLVAVPAVFLSVSSGWCRHNEVLCTACHVKSADESIPYTAEDLVQPKDLLCLTCHDANTDASGLNPPHVFNGRQELAGGSFTPTLYSDKVGHNIQSIDMTLGLTPPGGVARDAFECLSCHDGHDNGNFRNLKKEINGYQTVVMAEGDPNYRENVYISGMGNFCGACHEAFHGVHTAGGGSGSRGGHPVGITIYGASHADFDSWSRLENRVTETQHPSGSRNDLFGAEVFCLSCHRAHASPYTDAVRWDYSKNNQGCLECHTF